MAKKQKTVKYKTLSDQDIQDLKDLSKEKLLAEFLKQTKVSRDIKSRKASDSKLLNLKFKRDKHRIDDLSDDTRKELDKITARKKEIREESDEKIPEILKGIKEINTDYREELSYPREKMKAIQNILDEKD